MNEMQECAKNTAALLEELKDSSPDTLSLLDSRSDDRGEGVFVQIDRLNQAVGELEYEVSMALLPDGFIERALRIVAPNPCWMWHH
jgi:hypothetical protein